MVVFLKSADTDTQTGIVEVSCIQKREDLDVIFTSIHRYKGYVMGYKLENKIATFEYRHPDPCMLYYFVVESLTHFHREPGQKLDTEVPITIDNYNPRG